MNDFLKRFYRKLCKCVLKVKFNLRSCDGSGFEGGTPFWHRFLQQNIFLPKNEQSIVTLQGKENSGLTSSSGHTNFSSVGAGLAAISTVLGDVGFIGVGDELNEVSIALSAKK